MYKSWWIGKEVLITGGTGSLGKTLLSLLLNKYNIKGVRIFSRDEYKQWELKKELDSRGLLKGISFIIGDIKDEKSLDLAMRGVDVVLHTAAMKHIPICEANPLETVKTDIIGSANVITCALNNKVERVMNVSTDKAVEPRNLYGACKMVSEKVFSRSKIYRPTIFASCRYGNVLNSRGSVIPLFQDQVRQYGRVKVTSLKMTRFWVELETVAQFLLDRTCNMRSGKTYVPKMKSCSLLFIIETLYPEIEIEEIGIRKGEKLHEILISSYEKEFTKDCGDYFEIDLDERNMDLEGFEDRKEYNSFDNVWGVLQEEDLLKYKE